MIEKGYISTISADGRTVTAVPAFSGDVVSHELTVPFFLLDCLEVKTEIVYCCFPDNTGVVLARMDGDWNRKTAEHTHTDSRGGTTSEPQYKEG